MKINLHRNSQSRIYRKDFIYFITSKTKDSFPFFQEEILCDLWIDKLQEVKKLKNFKLFSFCLLYDHFHMVLQSGTKHNISEVIHSLKRNFSRDANKLILSTEGEVSEPRRTPTSVLNDDMNHRLQFLRDKFINKYGKQQNQFSKFQWQKSFHDHIIRNEKDLENHFNYTTYNFQKHELPDDWKYTSLNFPELINEI